MESLGLEVSETNVVDSNVNLQDGELLQPNSTGPDTIKENAVRQCISAVQDIGTYNSREIVTSYRYNPVVVAVYENKTFDLAYGGKKQGILQAGIDKAQAATAILDKF